VTILGSFSEALGIVHFLLVWHEVQMSLSFLFQKEDKGGWKEEKGIFWLKK
jgi:hypothetical protein